MELKTFAQAINDGLTIAMASDENVICYGLGTDDPKAVFGTTTGLRERFGPQRVFDMPTSENAMTGIGIGAALYGLRPVMTHQRMDFALLSMDQLVNNAAKWRFMFGGSCGVPFTVRMILGRGWGQGPTHSQNLQACFAHIPGLKVVMPSTAADAKGLLLASIFDDDPVIFLEHRWLHNITGNVPKGHERVALGKAAIIRSGSDVTVVSMSFMTIEALQAVDQLESLGINCELIDLRTVRPIDYRTIENSISKTGRLLVLDTGSLTGSISGEIVAAMCERCWNKLKEPPKRLAMPDYPEPTSHALTTEFYCDALKIVNAVCSLMNIVNTKSPNSDKLRRTRHDVPGGWFKGPF